jgi:hypothetical protein
MTTRDKIIRAADIEKRWEECPGVKAVANARQIQAQRLLRGIVKQAALDAPESEIEKRDADVLEHGQGFMKDGKHVPLHKIYKEPESEG